MNGFAVWKITAMIDSTGRTMKMTTTPRIR